MFPRLNIAVVGAGVAGSAACAWLARAGYRVTLFEQAAELLPVGAGLLLQPSGQVALRGLGLLETVVAQAEPIRSLHANCHHRSGRKTLLHLHYTDHAAGVCAYGVRRPDLFTPLHTAAIAAGTTVHLSRAPAGIDKHPDGRVSLRFAKGETTGPFDLVVAADGARSRLRTASRLHAFVHTYAFTALWVHSRCSAIRNTLFQITEGTRRLLGIVPTGGSRCSLFWGLTPGELPRIRAAGFGAWRTDCLRLAPEAAEIFETVTSFDQVTFAPFHHVVMPRWHNGRNLVFIGDAAHAMSPHFGQGVNLALLDALALADAIGACRDLPAALRSYEQARRAHTRLYASLSLALTPFFQGSGRLKAIGRNVALPLMARTPPIRKRMLETMTGLRPSLTGFGRPSA